jgi:hypothetical protein
MDFPEFTAVLAELPKAGFKPYIDKFGAIQLHDSEGKQYCPVTGVAHYKNGETYNISKFFVAGASLGLDESLVSDIVSAADNELYCDDKIRRTLLEALQFPRPSLPELIQFCNSHSIF